MEILKNSYFVQNSTKIKNLDEKIKDKIFKKKKKAYNKSEDEKQPINNSNRILKQKNIKNEDKNFLEETRIESSSILFYFREIENFYPFDYYKNLNKDINKEKWIPERFVCQNFKQLINFCIQNKLNNSENFKLKFNKFLVDCKILKSNLNKLESFLIKFFTGKRIDHNDLKLDSIEIVLLAFVLIKKRYFNLENIKFNCYFFNNLRTQVLKKRVDQNYRVIFKKLFSILKEQFESFNEFEKYYFAKAKQKLGLNDVSSNCVLSNSTEKIKSSGRNLKEDFGSIIRESKEFKGILKSYLKNDLKIQNKEFGVYKDYNKSIQKKIKTILKGWRSKNKSGKNIRARLILFLKNGLSNTKIKLPWGTNEVFLGVVDVYNLIK